MRKLPIMMALVVFCGLSSGALAQDSYDDLYQRAVRYIQVDSLEEAEALLIHTLELFPANEWNGLLFSNLAIVQQRLSKPDKAVESYSLALNFSPYNVTLLLSRAALYMSLGERKRAYNDYCSVLFTDSLNTEALLMRAYLHSLNKEYASARVDYKKLIKQEPNHYTGNMGLALLEQKEGNYQEAMRVLNAMIESRPKNAELYVIRAGVERDIKFNDLALIDLEQAIKLDADLPEIYLLRGEILLSQNNKKQAKQDFEKAIQLGIPAADLYKQLKKCN